ncbi:hypothetical protein MKX01_035833 [Papaver californicum]|nr:hypothetical protein MKX01_035833 [Papaver californicum]
MSPNQQPAIAVTAAASAAEHHRGVELENTTTGVDQRLTNVHEFSEALCKYSKKTLVRVKMEAAVRRSFALILMKHNDYVGAKKKLLDARTSDPGLEHIDELIKVYDIVCTAESQLQGSGIDWCSVLEIDKTSNESDIELKYKELIRTLETIKNKFPEIQSALVIVEKAYSVFTDREKRYKFDSRRAASLSPCGSVKPSNIAHSETRTVSEGSVESNLICNSGEQPLKRAGGFAVGQFLAVYDQEKMPRLYAQIIGMESCHKKETSSTGNVLYIRWLRPAPINPDEKKWHEVGLPVSCGFFKLDSGNIDKCDIVVGSRLVISHFVLSFREYQYSKELFELYPREGCKFLLVEILNDYSTAVGVKVASIVKVAGNPTIYPRSGLSYQIAAHHLFGFSRNIPVRSAGDMKGLFSGMVLDFDPLSIPEDAVLDTVAAEFTDGASIKQQNSRPAPITSMSKLIQL